jgi:hypothetical protein
MKRILSATLVVLFCLTLLKPQKAQAAMPAKARAFVTVVGYGTASGALLGAASMAFGQSTRAIAQGASIGLYAGILFGAYILVAHHQKRYGNYDDDSSPYKDSNDVYGDGYQDDEGGSSDEETEEDSGGSFFNRMNVIEQKFGNNRKGGGLPPLKINLVSIEF